MAMPLPKIDTELAHTLQTTGFVCPLCAQPLDLGISLHAWEVMACNNAFGHPWNTMLPRGLVFGRVCPSQVPETPYIEAIPKYMHIGGLPAYGYTPMHSRCFRMARHAWVQQNQEACDHERWTHPAQTLCPDCRKRM